MTWLSLPLDDRLPYLIDEIDERFMLLIDFIKPQAEFLFPRH